MIREAPAFSELADAARIRGDTVGFVPTMGALHGGHTSLIRRARDEHAFACISIFVNPLQFGPAEDLSRYPKDETADLAVCERLGVDAVWAPTGDQMYPRGEKPATPDPGPLGDALEGARRPGHFAGVLRAVRRLLDVCGPCHAYFGEKDAQQLFLVRRMVLGLALPVSVVPCPTVREPDGLALSSRNVYLTPEEREQAGCLFLALSEAAELARGGERDAAVLVAAMAREVGATSLARLDYASVVDEAEFEPVRTIEGPSRALIAARFTSARLIDNLLLPTSPQAHS